MTGTSLPCIAFLDHVLAFSENIIHNLLDLVMVEPGPRSDDPSLQLGEDIQEKVGKRKKQCAKF